MRRGFTTGVDSIGPGLAAGKRRADNAALAHRLADLSPIEPTALLRALCGARAGSSCSRLAEHQPRIYGLLFGENDARLQVLLEFAEAAKSGQVHTYSAVTAARPLEAFTEPGVLRDGFAEGLMTIADWRESSAQPAATFGRCNVGGRAYVSGQVIGSDDHHVLLTVPDPQPRRLFCPKEPFEAGDGRPPLADPAPG